MMVDILPDKSANKISFNYNSSEVFDRCCGQVIYLKLTFQKDVMTSICLDFVKLKVQVLILYTKK